MSPETITAWSAAVQAFAAVVSLVVASVLAFVTYRYTKLTKGILDETGRVRKASEDSARAALDSVRLMRQQIEEQAGLGSFIVESTIDRAVVAIEAILQPEPLTNFSVPESHSRLELLIEQQAGPSVSHAARINIEVANHLSSAFDLLRAGLASLSELIDRDLPPGHSARNLWAVRAKGSLESALAKLHAAKKAFHGHPTPRTPD